jgi:hypothetical protein
MTMERPHHGGPWSRACCQDCPTIDDSLKPPLFPTRPRDRFTLTWVAPTRQREEQGPRTRASRQPPPSSLPSHACRQPWMMSKSLGGNLDRWWKVRIPELWHKLTNFPLFSLIFIVRGCARPMEFQKTLRAVSSIKARPRPHDLWGDTFQEIHGEMSH